MAYTPVPGLDAPAGITIVLPDSLTSGEVAQIIKETLREQERIRRDALLYPAEVKQAMVSGHRGG